MRAHYLDTSAVLKTYRSEEGSENLETLYSLSDSSSKTLITSLYTSIEVASAGRLLVNRGEMTKASYAKMLKTYAEECRELFWMLSIDDSTVRYGEQMVKRYGLRPGDAIQLSSAVGVKRLTADLDTGLGFVASDHDLCAAADAEGLFVMDPARIDAASWKKMIE